MCCCIALSPDVSRLLSLLNERLSTQSEAFVRQVKTDACTCFGHAHVDAHAHARADADADADALVFSSECG